MTTIYYNNDANLDLLKNKVIGIIGYGSQGHAHALNLKDNGQNVLIGLYQGSKSWEKAVSDGLEVTLVDDLAKRADIIMMLLPDHTMASVYKESIEPYLSTDKTLMFAHGFNIHYKAIVPPNNVDVSMVAPKAPGHRMREVFIKDSGVPGLLAIHNDASGKAKEIALAYSKDVGCTRAGGLITTFKEETETDLFR